MSVMVNNKPTPNPRTLLIDERFMSAEERKIIEQFSTAEEKEQLAKKPKQSLSNNMLARSMADPTASAARVIQRIGGNSVNVNALVDELRAQVTKVKAGNLTRPEAMLVAQAHTLDALFSALAEKTYSAMGDAPDIAERFMRLALKAQAQTVRTIEALSDLQNPHPVTLVRQTNHAGQQIVNNHCTAEPPRGEKSKDRPNELLEHTHGQRLDFGATGTPGHTDTVLEAVGAIHRAKVTRG